MKTNTLAQTGQITYNSVRINGFSSYNQKEFVNSAIEELTMIKKLTSSAIILSATLLTGCASIVDGTHQHVSVETPPVTGAACSLKNNKGSWTIPSTPGSVTVHRSTQPIFIHCKKKGHKAAYAKFKSKTKGMLAGNIVFGGLIGTGIDAADGAAFDYPPTMVVPMNGKKPHKKHK